MTGMAIDILILVVYNKKYANQYKEIFDNSPRVNVLKKLCFIRYKVWSFHHWSLTYILYICPWKIRDPQVSAAIGRQRQIKGFLHVDGALVDFVGLSDIGGV